MTFFAGLAVFILGLLFAFVGGWGLSTFLGMWTDTEFRNANGVAGGIVPNLLFGACLAVGIANIFYGLQAMSGGA